jgi:hypothetical protein
MERLIVERLENETLVYDPEANEAHALSGPGAAEFLAATDEVSRRQVLRKLALAGAAAAGAGAMLRTIVAPSAAQAQSGAPCGGVNCQPGQTCCGAICITPGQFSCCLGIPCGMACCPAGSVLQGFCAAGTGASCSVGIQCCSNSCTNINQQTGLGTCA